MPQHTYRVILFPEPENGFTVTVPTLAGCITQGATLEYAVLMAKEAIELYIEVLREDGQEIPDDAHTLTCYLVIN
jgi:antitoxin HicB